MSCHCHSHASCGGGHGDSCCCGRHLHEKTALSEKETAFLLRLLGGGLPVARFFMTSSKNEDLESVVLIPIYIENTGDTMDLIQETGALLLNLAERGLVTLDEHDASGDGAQAFYRESLAFRTFAETVREGGRRESFLFDAPELTMGIVSLTAEGLRAAAQAAG